MIRVRLYSLALSMPFFLVVVGVVFFLSAPSSQKIGFNIGTIAFVSGFALQIVFALIFACPRCGKSPYAIGPSAGPFALVGKPIPDRQCTKCGHDFLATGD
jgi:hypothetical protein